MVAQTLYNYAQYKKIILPAVDDLTKFPDGDKESSWAQTTMKWAIGLGSSTGTKTAPSVPAAAPPTRKPLP